MNGKKLDISQRVSAIIEYYSLTISSLEKTINVSNNSIGTAIRRGADFKTEVLNKILHNFPEINPTWLLTGYGKMLESEGGEQKSKSRNQEAKDLDNDFIELPYVSLAARATFSASCDTIHEPQETYNTYRNTTFDYNNVKVLEVNGDSMEPTLVSGEKVLIREVSNSRWDYFTGLAAVAFKDMFVVKRITRNSGGMLTLSSDNPLGGSFDVKIDDVCCIYKIEHSVYRPLK